MTMLAAVTRVYRNEQHLVAECGPCAQTLHQQTGFDRDIAVGTFFQHHPNSTLAVHRPDLPAGWHIASDDS